MQVNRYLDDPHFDRIDHALGRPFDPMAETYRDHYAANKDGPEAAGMSLSGHWRDRGIRGDLHWFSVTTEGRVALRDYLREIGDNNKLWDVTWNGFTDTIVATSRSRARYQKWLDVSDCYDVPFGEFAKTARVRLTAPMRTTPTHAA